MTTDDRISRIGALAMALSLCAAPAYAQLKITDEVFFACALHVQASELRV
jgi:hypothetical protein